MDFPGKEYLRDPQIDLRYTIEIHADPEAVWPWLVQLGYHRAGWYIDTWWDRWIQMQVWPRLMPKEARGSYCPPATTILPEHQQLAEGDLIPDGPPGTAAYEVVALERHRLLVLYATSHFDYMAPRFVYRTRLAPRGAFCWAFVLEPLGEERTRLVSWWQAEAAPAVMVALLRPLLIVVDGIHQKQILKGVRRRVEAR